MQLGFSTNLTQFRIITNEDDVKLENSRNENHART